MELEGSFDNWTQRHTMQKSGKDFTLVKLLPPGVYQVGGCVWVWVLASRRRQCDSSGRDVFV